VNLLIQAESEVDGKIVRAAPVEVKIDPATSIAVYSGRYCVGCAPGDSASTQGGKGVEGAMKKWLAKKWGYWRGIWLALTTR
jgi:hypothetical protein